VSSEQIKAFGIDSYQRSLPLWGIDSTIRSQDFLLSDISYRGSTFQQVGLSLDGVEINDPQTAHFLTNVPVTLSDIKDIEVLSPVDSVMEKGLSGTLNLSTISEISQDNLKLGLSYGSHKYKGCSLVVDKKKLLDNMDVHLSWNLKESDDFVYDTDYKYYSLFGKSFLKLNSTSIDTTFGYLEKEFGAFDFYTPGLGFPSKEWIKVWLAGIGSKTDTSLGGSLKTRFLWRRHYDKFMLDKTRPQFYLNHHHTDIYRAVLGYEAEYRGIELDTDLKWGEDKISSSNLGSHDRNNAGGSIKAGWNCSQSTKLLLTAGTMYYSGYDQTYPSSLEFIYSLGKSELKLGAARTYRIPTFTELYYSDPTTVGNQRLGTEKAISAEAGYSFSPKADQELGVDFFFRHEDDLIKWARRVPNSPRWEAINTGEAQVRGINLYADHNFLDSIGLRLDYTYIDKRSKDSFSYKYGPDHSRHLVGLGFFFDNILGHQAIRYMYKRKPARSGWSMIDLYWGKPFGEHLEVFFDIQNALNTDYEEIVGVPAPGRILKAGLDIKW